MKKSAVAGHRRVLWIPSNPIALGGSVGRVHSGLHSDMSLFVLSITYECGSNLKKICCDFDEQLINN